jgi:hypothetical protein
MVTLRSASRVCLLLALCAFLSASLTHAQTVSGTITGTVLDSSRAALALVAGRVLVGDAWQSRGEGAKPISVHDRI